jgi:hypothetical protein
MVPMKMGMVKICKFGVVWLNMSGMCDWKIVEWIGPLKIGCLGFIVDNGIHFYMLLWNIKPLQNLLFNLQKNFVLTTKWITIIKDLLTLLKPTMQKFICKFLPALCHWAWPGVFANSLSIKSTIVCPKKNKIKIHLCLKIYIHAYGWQ